MKSKDPKLTFSFFKHLAIPRKVFMAVDSRHKLITNYVDIGVQLGFDPRYFMDATQLNSSQPSPLDMKIGASWQINKNNMIKARMDPEGVS